MNSEERVLKLYSVECLELLRQALRHAEAVDAASNLPVSTFPKIASSVHPDDDDDSSVDEVEGKISESSSSGEEEDDDDDEDYSEQQRESDSSDKEKEKEREDSMNEALLPVQEEESNGSNTHRTATASTTKRKKSKVRINHEETMRRIGSAPQTFLTLPSDDDDKSVKLAIGVPSALQNKKDYSDSRIGVCRSMESLSANLSQADNSSNNNKLVLVFLLRSGRFAAGIFQGDKCLAHRTSTRYTVRRGQGGAQSSNDSSKKKAKSMGAQLRRAGEEKLREDVANCLKDWSGPYLSHDRTALILISVPKTMQKNLFEDSQQYNLFRTDDRIRKVPLDFGRPSFESVCSVYDIMMRVTVGKAKEEEETKELSSTGATSVYDTDANVSREADTTKEVAPKPKPKEIVPLNAIHETAKIGNVSALKEVLEKESATVEEYVDSRAGEIDMTPLHYAALAHESDPVAAAECVTLLLLEGHANPGIVDARNRPPYFLARHEKVRDAFRRARATLGEDCWLWDERAKVGPPLTLDDVQIRKEKAAEKKRRQRQRQKEKKAREREQAEAAERQRKEEEEKKKKEEDAKRIRDGLAPKKKTAAGNVCDFCQTVCKGKRKSQMFSRLDYVYCSTDCVRAHQRELSAAAALARMGV